MALSSSTRFAFAVGKIRAVETLLLDASRLQRLVEAADLDEVGKQLADTPYADSLAKLIAEGDITGLETALWAEEERAVAFACRYLEDERLHEFVRLPYDAHNLKVICKGRLGNGAGDLLLGSGLVPLPQLEEALAPEAALTSINKRAQQLIIAVREKNDPRGIDQAVDTALYRELAALAALLHDEFVSRILAMRVDLLNLRSYLRVRAVEGSRETWEEGFLAGGTLTLRIFAELFREPLAVLPERLRSSRYAAVVQEGFDAFSRSGSYACFERLGDDMVLRYAREQTRLPFGFYPVLGYFLGRKNELQVLRNILVGKLNQLPAEDIRQRMRKSYV